MWSTCVIILNLLYDFISMTIYYYYDQFYLFSCYHRNFVCLDGESGNINEPLHTLSLHGSPVKGMVFNMLHKVCVSVDSQGMIEYWATTNYQLPTHGKS